MILKIKQYMQLAVIITTMVTFSGYAAKNSNPNLGDVEFKNVIIDDAVRILSEQTGQNIIVTGAASGYQFSLFMRDAKLLEVLDSMSRINGLWYRRNPDTGVYVIMTAEEYRKDVVVYRNEHTRVFTLKHQNVVSAANAIVALFGERVKLQAPVEGQGYSMDSSFRQNNNTDGNNSNNSNNTTMGRDGTTSGIDTEIMQGNTVKVDELPFELLEQINKKLSVDETDLVGSVAATPILITYNRLHNLLLVRTSDDKAMRDIAVLIKKMDNPVKQVLLQMKILKVTLGKNQHSIFDFQYTGGGTTTGPSSSMSSNPLGGSQLTEQIMGLGNNAAKGGSLVMQLAKGDWLARLQALESKNLAHVVSTPLIMASNNKEARLFVGEERPIVEGFSTTGGNISSGGAISAAITTAQVTKKEIGTLFRIWPRINSDGTVTLDIKQEVSTVNKGAATIPVTTGGSVSDYKVDTVTRSELDLTVVAKNTETIAIGGLVEESVADEERKVPVLGDIPLVGKLFTADEKEKTRSELVVLIRPYVYDSADLSDKSIEDIKRTLVTAKAENLVDDAVADDGVHRKSSLPSEKILAISKELKAILANRLPSQAQPVKLTWRQNGLLIGNVDSWQHNDYYINQVIVQNTGGGNKKITPTLLGNYWSGVAWIFEYWDNEMLIKPSEVKSVYLISSKPLEKVLQQHNVNLQYQMR